MLSKARTHQEILNLCDAYSLQARQISLHSLFRI
jgi:hypothetical protein